MLDLWWPLLLCRAIANGFHPTTHKVSLRTSKAIILSKTRASYYSHHLSQSTLRETNWLFRVSEINPYLNPYLIIYTTTPPWNLTKRFMGLRPSHTTPSWDLTKRFMELRPSHPTPPWNFNKSFMELRQSHTIAMSHQLTIDLSSITISCQYPTNQPTIHVFHFILNITKSHSHLISYNLHGIIHRAFSVKHSIRKASNHIREQIRTRAWNLP